MQAESPITVACIQMEPKIGEKKANVAHSLDKIAGRKNHCLSSAGALPGGLRTWTSCSKL